MELPNHRPVPNLVSVTSPRKRNISIRKPQARRRTPEKASHPSLHAEVKKYRARKIPARPSLGPRAKSVLATFQPPLAMFRRGHHEVLFLVSLHRLPLPLFSASAFNDGNTSRVIDSWTPTTTQKEKRTKRNEKGKTRRKEDEENEGKEKKKRERKNKRSLLLRKKKRGKRKNKEDKDEEQ